MIGNDIHVEETATGAAQFIRRSSSKEEELPTPKGRMSVGAAALRRDATVAATTRSSSRGTSVGAKPRGRVKRSHTSDALPGPTSSTRVRGATSPKRTHTTVTTSELPSRSTSMDPSSRFKRQGTGTKTSSLLDDDSDLSDPDEAYDRQLSLLAGGTNIAASPGLTLSPTHGTVSMASLLTSTTHHSSNRNASERMASSASVSMAESHFEWDDPMAPPSGLQQDFSLGTVDMNARSSSVVSVPLMGHSSGEGGTRVNPPQGFFARFFARRESSQTKLGSTALAGFGKKYQVDQSVNLMDMENATRVRGSNRKQSIMSQILFDSSFQDIGLGPSQQARRSFYKPETRLSLWDKIKARCCGWGAILIWISLVGGICLILSLVYDGSTSNHPVNTPSPTVVTTTLEPTAVPVTGAPVAIETEPEATVETRPTETNELVALRETDEGEAQQEDLQEQLSLAARERWEDLVGLITRHGLTPKEDFDNSTSSAYKALDWMIEYDSQMDSISSDVTTQILENYALAVFYFATHPHAKARDAKRVSLLSAIHHTQPGAYDPNKDWIHHAATPMCHWDGVHCGHLKRVVVLNLTRHELKGTLPGELKALEHLIDMDLSHNQIGGTLPPQYGEFERLKLLVLRDNQLKGTYPDTWTQLTRLQSLDLTENEGLEGRIPQV